MTEQSEPDTMSRTCPMCDLSQTVDVLAGTAQCRQCSAIWRVTPKVVYFAHPLRGATPEATRANRIRASELVAYAAAKYKVSPVCSWIVLSEHWTEEEGRELGLALDKAAIERCDEIWTCGPVKPLSEGMQIEHDHAVSCGVEVVNMRGSLV
jgi:hypothetical protein